MIRMSIAVALSVVSGATDAAGLRGAQLSAESPRGLSSEGPVPYPLLGPPGQDGSRPVLGAVFTPRLLARRRARPAEEPDKGRLPVAEGGAGLVLIAWEYVPRVGTGERIAACTLTRDPESPKEIEMRPHGAAPFAGRAPEFVEFNQGAIQELLGSDYTRAHQVQFVAAFRPEEIRAQSALVWSLRFDCGDGEAHRFSTGVVLRQADIETWR